MKTLDQFLEARLTADQRRALPNKDFALPGKGEGPKGKQAGSYPIPDEKHARSALSLVSQHGTPEEKATVRAKVKKKFPDIQQEDYETKKTGEVLAAFKRDPKVRKRFEKAAKKEGGPGSAKNRAADDMLQTAKDTAKRKGDTSKSDDRYAYEETILEKDLNAAERRALPNKDFALPGKGKGPEGKQAGSYPIPDEKHARSALSLVAQHGTPEEKATVRAKVKKKFPEIQQEGVMKFVKSIGKKKKVEKKPSMDTITTKVHKWRKDREKEERRKYVSDFDPIEKVNEADDKAYNYVVSQLKKKYGKDAVLTKHDKIKPPTAAQKKAADAHRAKLAKQDHRDPTEKASDGRYSDRYSNRGSD